MTDITMTEWKAQAATIDGQCPCSRCGRRGETRGQACGHCKGKGKR